MISCLMCAYVSIGKVAPYVIVLDTLPQRHGEHLLDILCHLAVDPYPLERLVSDRLIRSLQQLND